MVAVFKLCHSKGVSQLRDEAGLGVSKKTSIPDFTLAGSFQSVSSVVSRDTELRTATVGRRGLASTVVRMEIWLHYAGRDSKGTKVEDVAWVNLATFHRRTSSASRLSGLDVKTRGALSVSLTPGATASWSRAKRSSLIWTMVLW